MSIVWLPAAAPSLSPRPRGDCICSVRYTDCIKSRRFPVLCCSVLLAPSTLQQRPGERSDREAAVLPTLRSSLRQLHFGRNAVRFLSVGDMAAGSHQLPLHSEGAAAVCLSRATLLNLRDDADLASHRPAAASSLRSRPPSPFSNRRVHLPMPSAAVLQRQTWTGRRSADLRRRRSNQREAHTGGRHTQDGLQQHRQRQIDKRDRETKQWMGGSHVHSPPELLAPSRSRSMNSAAPEHIFVQFSTIFELQTDAMNYDLISSQLITQVGF